MIVEEFFDSMERSPSELRVGEGFEHVVRLRRPWALPTSINFHAFSVIRAFQRYFYRVLPFLVN